MKENLIRLSWMLAIAVLGVRVGYLLARRATTARLAGGGALRMRAPAAESISFWSLLVTAWGGGVLISLRLDVGMPTWFLGLASGVLAALALGGLYALQRATWRLEIDEHGVRARDLLRGWRGPEWSGLLQVVPTQGGQYIAFEDQAGSRLVVGGWVLRDSAVRDAITRWAPEPALTDDMTQLLERWEFEVGRPES